MSLLKLVKHEVVMDGDVATVHIDPSYKHMMRMLNTRTDELKKDLGARKVRFELMPSVQVVQIKEEQPELKPTNNSVKQLTSLSTLPDYPTVALDFETSGINALECKIYSFAITDVVSLDTYYFDLRDNTMLLVELRDYLVDKTVVVHNASFERKLLNRIGATDYHLLDTMIYSYLDDSSRRKGLKSLAAELFKIKMTEFTDLVGKGTKKNPQISYLEVPRDKAAQYCGDDTYVTAMLYNHLKDKVDSKLVALDHRTALACIDLETAGVRVDAPRLHRLRENISNWVDLIEKKMYQLAGEEFDLNSPKQLADVVYGRMKIPPTKDCYTPKKSLSTSEKAINSLAQEGTKSPFLALLLKYRELFKIRSTYIDPILELTQDGKKRLHSTLNYCGTESGRYSSSKPNLQNLPASGLGKEIRRCLIANEGSRLVTADYSQIEIRILAHLMADENVIESIKQGLDMHTATASKVFKVPIDEVTKELRSQSKTLNFAKIYGQGISATAKLLGVTKNEALKIEQMYYDTFPTIKDTINQEILSCKLKGYTATLLGRKRWLLDINSADEYRRARAERQTFNTVIQGTAAEVARCACIRIREELLVKYPQAKFILQVHDEFVFDVPEVHVEQFKKDLVALMEDPFYLDGERILELRVPLTVDVDDASNYGDSK